MAKYRYNGTVRSVIKYMYMYISINPVTNHYTTKDITMRYVHVAVVAEVT